VSPTSSRLLGVFGLFAVFVIWWAISNSGWVTPLYLPSPEEVLLSFVKHSGDMPRHVGASMYRIAAGFAIGSSLGIVMGLFIGWNKVVGALLEPLVEFIRPMPPLALIPLFILWFGIGDDSKIIVIAFGSWVVLVVTTIDAVRNVDPIFINAARLLGAKGYSIFRTILFPAILPVIMGGLRVAAAGSFGMSVAAEFMGTSSGFGYLIIEGRRFIQTDMLLMGVFAITICSMIVNWLLKWVERRFTRWVPRK